MKNFLETSRYETIDSSTIRANVYSDGGESDFLFLSQPKEGELTISEFYAKCVKYYCSSYLNYNDTEGHQDYMEFYGELPDVFQEVSQSEAISLVKDWWRVLSLDPEKLKAHLSKFDSNGFYVAVVNVNDEFNMLVETENEFIFIYTLI
jgi:hypothetical protein